MRGPTRLARRAVLATSVSLLCGCAVRPLYGPTTAAEGAPPRSLALTTPSGRDGYLFREAMRRRFDLDADAADRLMVELQIEEVGVALTRAGDTTRFNIDGLAFYTLTSAEDGEASLTGRVRSFSGYSTLASPYATRVARDAATERVISDLAERVFAAIAVRQAAGA